MIPSGVIVARVINDEDRAFNVRLVRRGDRYGLNDCLVHDKDEPLVEFWDATLENDPRFTPGLGQFASRYFLGTLTGKEGYYGHDHRVQPRGIALCGHVPEWTVTGGNVAAAIAAVEAALSGGAAMTRVRLAQAIMLVVYGQDEAPHPSARTLTRAEIDDDDVRGVLRFISERAAVEVAARDLGLLDIGGEGGE